VKRIFKNIIVTFLCLTASVSYAVESVEVQALFSKKVVVLIDGVRRTLSVGKPSPEGVKLISASSTGAKLEVNGEVKDYQLGSSVSLTYVQVESLEERVFANDRGMFLRTGTINGQTVKFLIDTGATTVAMNKKQAKRLGVKYRLEGKESGASTASGYVKAYEVHLKSVSLGKIRKKNVRAMVIDGDHPGPVLLGMSFMSSLTVEKSGDELVLRQRK